MFTSLTSQSGLPTEAVEAHRAIKGLAAATKTKAIHLRPQRDRMQATYSNPKPAHKNSRKIQSVQEPRGPFEVRHLETIPIRHPSIFEGGLSSRAACPVVDELFPFSLCLYFPVETDTKLLFSWANILPHGPPHGARPRTASKVAAGGTVVVIRGSPKKDDPPLTVAISSIL